MTNPDCDVCSGRSKIRVPIYPRLTAAPYNDVPTYQESSREYPCPECSEVVPTERIDVVKTEGFGAQQYENDPRFIESVKYGLVRELAGLLVERGLVKFESGPASDFRFAMRLTVGVVSPSQVATIEQRVETHQTTLARMVMSEAKRQIDNWGSHYGHEGLSKSQARDSVDSALKVVLDEMAKWKAA